MLLIKKCPGYLFHEPKIEKRVNVLFTIPKPKSEVMSGDIFFMSLKTESEFMSSGH